MAKVKRRATDAQQTPFVPYEDVYACALCDEIIPDGALVLGAWNGQKLVGVRVEVLAETVEEPGKDPVAKMRAIHKCGKPVEGSGEQGTHRG